MTEFAESASTVSRRILLVDDISHVAQALEEMLVEFGHQVDMVPGGEEALVKYEPGKYDLVITDYSMPRMNGVDLAKAIRERSPQQLILLMISPAYSGTAKTAQQAQANYILPKPFSVKEFQEALAAIFSVDRQTA
jgi:CheY-like chemotaxis protein